MDKAWTKIADAVMAPVLGPQLDDLASLIGRDNRPSNQGSAYGSGWYGYVDKDLRRIARRDVDGRFKTKFCGAGDLTACRSSLWAALDQVGDRAGGRAGHTQPRRLAGRRNRREDPLRSRDPAHHDALDEPAHVPAGDQLLGGQVNGCWNRGRTRAGGASAGAPARRARRPSARADPQPRPRGRRARRR